MRIKDSSLLVLLMILLVGCGSGSMEGQVTGNVTLDGKTIGPGSVVFVPEGDGNPATGTIQIDGTYEMKSNRTPGLPPGKYFVSVSVFDQRPGTAGERSSGTSKLITPEKYYDAKTSGLEFTVESGSNEYNIELTSQ